MPTFIARSGSFNNLKITGLSSNPQINIVTIDTASGQLFYSNSSSVGLTITNNQNGNLLTATGGTTIRGSLFLNIKDLNSGPTYPSATQAVFSLASETSIASAGTQYKWVTFPFGGFSEGFMTSSAYKIAFGRGLVTYENGVNVNNGTNVPALYIGNYNDTSSFVGDIVSGYQPLFVIGSGTSNSNRKNALTVFESGEIKAGVLNITQAFNSIAPVYFFNSLNVNGNTTLLSLSGSNAYFTRASGSFTGSFSGSFIGDGSGLTGIQLPPPPYSAQYAYKSNLSQYDLPYTDSNEVLITSGLKSDGYGLSIGTGTVPYDILDINSYDLNLGLTLNNGRIQLNPIDPLPTGQLGSIAVSGSSLWFHNGSTWKEVNLL